MRRTERLPLRKGPIFRKRFAVLLQESFFAGALNRGIFTRQDRPHCWLELKLADGADEQVGFVRP
jgi:hypothetical protein